MCKINKSYREGNFMQEEKMHYWQPTDCFTKKKITEELLQKMAQYGVETHSTGCNKANDVESRRKMEKMKSGHEMNRECKINRCGKK